ncbi:DUF4212 domain-containing protein [Alteraurantiacibacter aestuarii]|uniref:DUF4212 domain-containing protein n=1 Tax=Alteraurantiacibacter aestuarii TaxID=650004 RepID=UPI0031E4167B
MSDTPIETPEDGESAAVSDNETADSSAYWTANLKLLGILMAIWFAVSFGAGILFRGWLDQFSIGGYPLGFWFAQQGSIYVFIALIFYYTFAMRRLERKYHLED